MIGRGYDRRLGGPRSPYRAIGPDDRPSTCLRRGILCVGLMAASSGRATARGRPATANGSRLGEAPVRTRPPCGDDPMLWKECTLEMVARPSSFSGWECSPSACGPCSVITPSSTGIARLSTSSSPSATPEGAITPTFSPEIFSLTSYSFTPFCSTSLHWWRSPSSRRPA